MHLRLALLIALSASVHADAQRTWVVDDDGGAGVDFREIQPAFQAASDEDTVLVRAGQYASPIVLTKGLRVVADGLAELDLSHSAGGSLAPSFRIRGLPVGSTAAIAGFDHEHFLVSGCGGTVILDGHLERGLDGVGPVIAESGPSLTRIIACADVRVRGHRIGRVERSTVEYVQGRDVTGRTIRVLDGSSLHLVGGKLVGQYGEDPGCHFCIGEDGQEALIAEGSSIVIADSALSGGRGGVSSADPSYDGQAAPAVGACGGELRTSDVDATGGLQGGWFEIAPFELACGASLVDVAPRIDPVLRMSGDPIPGRTMTVRVDGTPGDNIRLLFGRQAARVPVPGSPIDRLVQPGRLSALGAIPASGCIEFTFVVPPQWSAGTLLHLQASAVAPGGQAIMTGSVPLIVRF